MGHLWSPWAILPKMPRGFNSTHASFEGQEDFSGFVEVLITIDLTEDCGSTWREDKLRFSSCDHVVPATSLTVRPCRKAFSMSKGHMVKSFEQETPSRAVPVRLPKLFQNSVPVGGQTYPESLAERPHANDTGQGYRAGLCAFPCGYKIESQHMLAAPPRHSCECTVRCPSLQFFKDGYVAFFAVTYDFVRSKQVILRSYGSSRRSSSTHLGHR